MPTYRHHTARLTGGFAVAALSFILLSSCGKKAPEGAAAVVNDEIIPLEDLAIAVENLSNQFRSYGMELDSTRVDSLRGKVLEQMIGAELLYQESRHAGYELSDEELEQEIGTIVGQYHDKEMFETALSMQGLTEDTFRRQIARNLTIRNFVQGTIAEGIDIPREERMKYYEEHPAEFRHEEQVAAKHILIQAEESDPPESLAADRARAETLLASVRQGGDFEALARDNSEGPSAPRGGELGFFARGQMVKPFEDAAFALQPGEVSDIVQTRFGFHIIQVYDRREAGTATFEDVESDIGESLKQERVGGELDTLVESLKAKAEIEILI